MSNGKLGVTLKKIPKNELGVLVKKFNEMSLSIVELLRKNEEIQDEKRKLEIETLQNQINPHFIYNTLNMIKWMGAVINAKNIVDSIVALGNILRPVFKENNQMCTIKEEVEYLENYLKIMNWRYGNSANFEIDVTSDLMDFKIPRFILQPIIENSFTHGISTNNNLININIKAYEHENNLLLVVSDTGIGINEGRVEEINKMLDNGTRVESTDRISGIGLYNVNKRIRLNSGKEFGIRLISCEGVYTKVLINIPKIY